jgi:type II secretory pathway pseudopilin PulG
MCLVTEFASRPEGARPARGVTFVELLVGMTLLAIIGGLVANWFFAQRRYQERMVKLSEIQENTRQAIWRVVQEMKTGRQIIWPRVNADGSPRTDTVVVFKDFRGRFVSFYHQPADRTIRRCVIPNGAGAVAIDGTPIGKGIASASFTVMGADNKLLSIHLTTEGVHQIDAVRLVNE